MKLHLFIIIFSLYIGFAIGEFKIEDKPSSILLFDLIDTVNEMRVEMAELKTENKKSKEKISILEDKIDILIKVGEKYINSSI